MRIWNGIRHSSYYDEIALMNYIGKISAEFRQMLNKATDPLRDDPDFCLNAGATTNEMKQAPCETMSDVFFMLDVNGEHPRVDGSNSQTGLLDTGRRGNQTFIYHNS